VLDTSLDNVKSLFISLEGANVKATDFVGITFIVNGSLWAGDSRFLWRAVIRVVLIARGAPPQIAAWDSTLVLRINLHEQTHNFQIGGGGM